MPRLNEHLEIKRSIDPITGKIESEYLYRGVECPTKPISGRMVTNYIGYYLILKDLEDTEAWMKQIHDLYPNHAKKATQDSLDQYDSHYRMEKMVDDRTQGLIKSLFFSSIIFYAKCFTQAKGRRIKLAHNFIPTNLLDKHNTIMDVRHNLAAHSGPGEFDTGWVDVIHPPLKFIKSNVGLHIMPVLNRLNFLDDRADDSSFLSLISAVKEKVTSKTQVLGEKIIRELVVPKGQEYWYRK
jgi:hypothetical protein